MAKKKTLAKVVDEVAVKLQRLVRLKAARVADKGGYIECWTCNEWDHYSKMDGGHFISRKRTATKIMEENIHPQCKGCNVGSNGNSVITMDYERAMVDYYGKDFVEEMKDLSREVKKHDRIEMIELKKEYERQIKDLEATL